MEEGRGGGKLQAEVGRGVDGQFAARHDLVEHVAAGLPVRGQEMEVDPGTFRPHAKSSKPKPASVP